MKDEKAGENWWADLAEMEECWQCPWKTGGEEPGGGNGSEVGAKRTVCFGGGKGRGLR